MSQYLSFVTALVLYFRQNPQEALKLWGLVQAAYESAHSLAAGLTYLFGQVAPREVAVVLTPDEEEAETEFSGCYGAPRGPFGNGKVLRWLLTTEEGKALLALLKSKIPGVGS